MATSQFGHFDRDAYSSIFAKIISGDINVLKDTLNDAELALFELPVEFIEVTEF